MWRWWITWGVIREDEFELWHISIGVVEGLRLLVKCLCWSVHERKREDVAV
jgi:hypothetical protein